MSVLQGASLALTAVGTAQKIKGDRMAADAVRQSSQYNASIDMAQAAQLESDLSFNISQERQQGKQYMATQEAAYASSGVLLTGSPLAVMVTTAGRLEQRIQNEYIAGMRKADQYRSSAAEGLLEGQDKAMAYNNQAFTDLLIGGATYASQSYKAYDTTPQAYDTTPQLKAGDKTK